MGWLIDLIPLSYSSSVVVIGSAILGIAAGVLGTFAVLRERSLVGDAVAHSALPGVAIAFIVTGAKDAGTLLVGAGIAGIVGALMMVGIERSSRIRPDAAIGVVLSSFFSLGIVLLTFIANGDNANQAGLEKYLFGQAAGLLERDLVIMGSLAAASLIAVTLSFRVLKTTLFDRDFAGGIGLPVRLIEIGMTALLVVAVVIGLRAVGAILMVALLVAPPVAARQLTNRLSLLLPLAGLLGAVIGVSGAMISTRAELPTGPVIVIAGMALVTVAILLAPHRGVAWRYRVLRRERRHRLVEGVLIDLETSVHAGPPPTVRDLEQSGGRSRRALGRALGDLSRAGLVIRDGDRIHLSEAGAAAAHAVLERRSLWSAWLEHGWRLDLPDAREPDPSDVRGSLGDAWAEQLVHHARVQTEAS